MPTLLEVQQAMRGSLVAGDDAAMTTFLADPTAADRLSIYRNTFILSLTKALTICYPVVKRLVGEVFFEGAAQHFVARHPPRTAYLDRYGGDFSEFLRHFPSASSLSYLADVAALEWAVSGALHAADAMPLDLRQLACLGPNEQSRLCFVGHPSVRLLRLDHPADTIWRAILADDDAELGEINLDTGPVHLLVGRSASGVEVIRLEEPVWRLAGRLFSGDPLELALEETSGFDASAILADHLSSGRFVSFELAPHDGHTLAREAR
jgi:Putative DNA-binding domain